MAKVRVGSIEVAVWENKDEKNTAWHSVTIQRHYKANDEWKNTQNFRLTDLRDIVAALQKVNEEMRVKVAGKFNKTDLIKEND